MDIIMSGSATNAQIAGLLVALRMKGETIAEITGFAKGMRQKAKHVTGCENSIEIVGTGGDLANSFNISTTSSFVISAAGMPVAKHGNRSVSSKSGAADVLESLGVKIQTTPEQAKASIQEIGISFLFAQSYHGAMKYVAPARKELHPYRIQCAGTSDQSGIDRLYPSGRIRKGTAAGNGTGTHGAGHQECDDRLRQRPAGRGVHLR